MRIHGGDRKARLDFSSNINPLAPPAIVYDIVKKCLEDRVLESYPDYNYADLRNTLSKFYKCEAENVVPTSGANEAINLAILATKPKRIAVLEPSYGEYEDLANILGIDYTPVFYVRKGDEFLLDIDSLKNICKDSETLIVLTNPSNPLGLYIDKHFLLNSLSRCNSKILLDEAYAELCSRCEFELNINTSENIIFVRSLTKWLGIPGLRIGFLYTSSRELVNVVNTLRQPWNVNSLAECLIVNLFENYINEIKEFVELSRRYIDSEKTRLSKTFRELGFTVFRSDTNFILTEIENGLEIVQMLRKEGIAVRDCSSFKGLNSNFIRIAVRKREENNELIEVLRRVLKK